MELKRFLYIGLMGLLLGLAVACLITLAQSPNTVVGPAMQWMAAE